MFRSLPATGVASQCVSQRKHQMHPPTPPQEPQDMALPSPVFSAPATPADSNTPRSLSPSGFETPSAILINGLHVLHTTSVALAQLSQFYSTSAPTQDAFTRAVRTIVDRADKGGKLVICGMGKSGRIGEKLAATFNSLGFVAVFLHPAEAVHGDVGMVKKNDTLLLLTYSGATAELSALLPHLPASCPRILLTSHTDIMTCPLLRAEQHYARNTCRSKTKPGAAPEYILLPTPVPETELASFGVPAPTTSICVTLAVGHALAVAAAKEYYEGEDVDQENEDDGGDHSLEDQYHCAEEGKECSNRSIEQSYQQNNTHGGDEQTYDGANNSGHENYDTIHEVMHPKKSATVNTIPWGTGISSLRYLDTANTETTRNKQERRGTVAQAFARNHPGGALGAALATKRFEALAKTDDS